jgi:hypothetical protein
LQEKEESMRKRGLAVVVGVVLAAASAVAAWSATRPLYRATGLLEVASPPRHRVEQRLRDYEVDVVW